MKVYCKNCKWLHFYPPTFVGYIMDKPIYPHVESTYYGCTNLECGIESGNWFAEGYKGGRKIHPHKINKNNDCLCFEEVEE